MRAARPVLDTVSSRLPPAAGGVGPHRGVAVVAPEGGYGQGVGARHRGLPCPSSGGHSSHCETHPCLLRDMDGVCGPCSGSRRPQGARRRDAFGNSGCRRRRRGVPTSGCSCKGYARVEDRCGWLWRRPLTPCHAGRKTVSPHLVCNLLGLLRGQPSPGLDRAAPGPGRAVRGTP
jgi:hypothetical protein